MSLNPRAIALQGIGFGALLLAVQGFAPETVQQVVGMPTPGYTATAPRPWAADGGVQRVARVGETHAAAGTGLGYTAKAPKRQPAAAGQQYTAKAAKPAKAKPEAKTYVAKAGKNRSA